VVASLAADDGKGATPIITDYEYRDLRASPSGRGPQGFSTIIVTGPVDLSQSPRTRIETETAYLQPFPYTGMPSMVRRYVVDSSSGNKLAMLSETTTNYCDAIPETSAPVRRRTRGRSSPGRHDGHDAVRAPHVRI